LEERVKRAMEKLPAEQRAALIFRDVEGLSYQEMAEAMGCSIGTVMSRLHYGRKRMQELLKDYVELYGQSRGTSTVSKGQNPPKL
jgi:RNA polymerase sigma-70 factor, ECF subfamily